jgi:hypothetical protein
MKSLSICCLSLAFWWLVGLLSFAQNLQPPTIISPKAGEELKGSVLFSWFSLQADANTTYAITIVELLSFQSPQAAIMSNPIFFQASDIRVTSYWYPPNAPRFQKGRSYAWQVSLVVELEGNQLLRSEVEHFEYKSTSSEKKKKKKVENEVPYWMLHEGPITHAVPSIGDTLGFSFNQEYAVSEGFRLYGYITADHLNDTIHFTSNAFIPSEVREGVNQFKIKTNFLPFGYPYTLHVLSAKGEVRRLIFRKQRDENEDDGRNER